MPASATRVALVVDGGAISGYTTGEKDFPAGTSTVTIPLGIPAGTQYRIRAVAFDALSTGKQILRSGKVSGITIGPGATVPASISLSDVVVTLDSTTPSLAIPGTTVNVRFNIADAGDIAEGSIPTLFYDQNPFPIAAGGRYSSSNSVQHIGESDYSVTLPLTVPAGGSMIYYALNFPATKWGGVRFYSPTPALNGIPWQMGVTSGSGVALTVTNIPAVATYLAVLVDGGSLSDYVSGEASFPVGSSSVTMQLGVPAGNGYRIRAIACNSTSPGKQILRSGKAIGITIAPGATVRASVAVFDVVVARDPGTPSFGTAGTTVNLRFNIVDPGDVVEGSFPTLYYDQTSFQIETGGRYSSWSGVQHVAEATYAVNFAMSLPTSGSLCYYALNYSLGSKWGGARIYSPNAVPNASPWHMEIVAGSGVNLTVTNIPETATRVSVLVNGGANSEYATAEQDFPTGTAAITIPIGIPAGGPYRIRALAFDNISTRKEILRSGKAIEISIASGATISVVIALMDVLVTQDPSTPSSASAGSTATIRFNIRDAGDIVEGSSPTLYYDQSAFPIETGSRWSTSNPVQKTGDGTYTVVAAINVPSSGLAVYYAINQALQSGTVRLYSRQGNLTIVPASSALLFVPVTPCRIFDTRNPAGPFGGPALNNNSRNFSIPNSTCGIPATAQAYSVNVTVIPTGWLGFVTMWPTGLSRPTVSTLNSLDGRIKAGAAIVPAGANGSVSVFATNAADLVLDINGYFVGSSDPAGLAYYPVTPCRLVDTREATNALGGPALVAGQRREFPLAGSCGIPSTARAYALNFTAVPSASLGFLSTWPAGSPQPLVSTLNALTGGVTANAAMVPAGTDGAVSVYATQNTHLVIDVNGYFAPPAANGLSFYTVNPCRVVDTRSAVGPLGGPSISGQRSLPLSTSSCRLPPNAQAFSLNATVVPQGSLGYLALWPAGLSIPVVSTLNALDGSLVSNAAIVPTSNGSINAYTTSGTDLILDANGYFAP